MSPSKKGDCGHDHGHHQHGGGHGHSHGHHHHMHGIGSSADAAAAAFRFTFFLNLAFVVIEVVGGYYSGSLSILADAAHDAGDCLALAMAWFFSRLAQKKRDSHFSYGYGRFSLLGAVVSGTAIFFSSLAILFTSVPKILNPSEPNGLGMLALAVLGVAVNGAAALRLAKGSSVGERILIWHYIEDVLGWVAVLLGGLGVYYLGWNWLDPLLAVFIAIFVLRGVWKNLGHVVPLFLQAVPEEIDLKGLEESIRAHKGVADLHDLHTWSIDGQHHILSVHVVQSSSGDTVALKTEIREIAAKYGKFHVTIEVEGKSEDCHDVC